MLHYVQHFLLTVHHDIQDCHVNKRNHIDNATQSRIAVPDNPGILHA